MGDGVELMLVNARHVKNLPGRKSDVSDSAWLAQLAECGLLRGSFIAPAVIAELRDLTRYRKKLIEDRVRETQRLQKILEDAGIKLDSVATDVLGVGPRRMIEALIGGERDPEVLAEMALTRMRSKIGDLREALVGRFGPHHARMARLHLDHIDYLAGQIDRLDANIDEVIAPFVEAVRLLKTIPGVGDRTAQVIIAEIGTDMTRFASAGHLASWAGLCPGNHESAGKSKSGRTRKGNTALRTALCEAAWVASRTKGTYLSAQYRRFRRRFGSRSETKAIFAVAHTMIVIVWHVLAENVEYNELGENYFNGRNETQQRVNRLVAELRRLGQTVTLEPAA